MTLRGGQMNKIKVKIEAELSEEDFDNLVEWLIKRSRCPSEFNLRDRCDKCCDECWPLALITKND